MDWNVQRSISDKIKEAAKNGDIKAAVKELMKGTEICLQSISQAVDGYTNCTIPCTLAALRIAEKTIIKMHARPEDIHMAEILSNDKCFTCTAISIPYGEGAEGAGADKE